MRLSQLILLAITTTIPSFAVELPGSPVSFPDPRQPSPDVQFDETIRKVEQMVWDKQANALAQREGLNVVNVTWEDTGRWKGSSVGPNISDMTIGVRDSRGQLHPMPVIRFDNFNDKTADLKTSDFSVLTGNEDGNSLRPTKLADLLSDVRDYLHDPSSMRGIDDSLLAKRDSHVLVSAQAAFLPVPREGKATFTPVIYNYQSYAGNPAVLTIVATREGTSIQVVENDEGYMSEVLYFNKDGERAPFTATRISDFKASGGDSTTRGHQVVDDAGLNTVLVIQVPLKHTPRMAYEYEAFDDEGVAYSMAPSAKVAKSDVESAVIGHGPTEGPFEEIGGHEIERDPRFPVRVTVQFYKATSNGVVSASDVRDVRKQIDRVYNQGDYVGSLVTAGYTGRPTEMGVVRPHGPSARWASPWWTWHKAR